MRGLCLKIVAIPKPFFQFCCKYPQIKAGILHFNCISSVSFQIHCGTVQGQNYENCVTVQIFPDLTVVIKTITRSLPKVEGP